MAAKIPDNAAMAQGIIALQRVAAGAIITVGKAAVFLLLSQKESKTVCDNFLGMFFRGNAVAFPAGAVFGRNNIVNIIPLVAESGNAAEGINFVKRSLTANLSGKSQMEIVLPLAIIQNESVSFSIPSSSQWITDEKSFKTACSLSISNFSDSRVLAVNQFFFHQALKLCLIISGCFPVLL